MGKKKSTNENEVSKYLQITKEAKAKYGEKTLVFYQVGSFYEVYALEDPVTKERTGSDIDEFSRICDMKVTPKSNMKPIDGKTIVMAGEPLHGNPERKIRKLVENGYTVPVYQQDPTVKTIRSLTHVESPGTEVNVDSDIISNNTMCLWINSREKTMINKNPFLVFGMCCVDVCTGSVNLYEYKKSVVKRNQSTIYDSLERFYQIHDPSELVIIHNFNDSDSVDELIQFTGIHCVKIHVIHVNDEENIHHTAIANSSSQIYQQDILEKYYQIPDFSVFSETYHLDSQPMATQAYCFILDFIFSHNANLVKNLSEPFTENLESNLLLANHSLCQLNILNIGRIKGHLSSISSLLNKTKTPMGKRLFRQQILHPRTDIEYLNKEYEITDYIIDNWDTFESVRKDFSKFKDLEKLYRKIVLNRVSPCELVLFYENMGLIMNLNANLSKDATIQSYLLGKISDIEQLETNCIELREMLNDNILLDKAENLTSTMNFDGNFFQQGVNSEIDSTQISIDKNFENLYSVQAFFNKCIRSIEKKSKTTDFVKIHTTEKSPLFLITTQKRTTFLETALKKVDWEKYPDLKKVIDGMAYKKGPSSNKQIQSPKLLEIYNTIFGNTEKMKELLRDEFKSFVRKLQETDKQMHQFVKYISLLDVIFNKAYIAIKNNYCKPTICNDKDKSFLDTVQLRHPLIEKIQRNETYVPNDLHLGCNNQDGVLLYGTNAAGKTSFIRSLGIAVIMAQSGCYVAAQQFCFKPYTSIYTRILGNDNLFKSLSTFQVEMCELNTILRHADENSLILGDELCSGTEITSGISLVTSGIENLNSKKCSYIFATHLHHLTQLKHITELERLAFKHMSVEYNRQDDELIWTRILEDGPGDDMYGLEVCKSLGMPQKFLERAFQIRLELRPEKAGVLSQKKTKYNAQKLKGNCEMCKARGVDVHHLMPQELANDNGFIDHIHKNHPANIVNVCKDCHDKETRNKTCRRRTKTSNGMKLLDC